MDALLASSIELATAKSAGERLAEALELMEWGIAMQRSRLRAKHPTAAEKDIDGLLVAWLCREE